MQSFIFVHRVKFCNTPNKCLNFVLNLNMFSRYSKVQAASYDNVKYIHPAIWNYGWESDATRWEPSSSSGQAPPGNKRVEGELRGVLGADVKFEGDTRGVERDSEGKLGDLGVYWGADEGFRGDTGGEEEILGAGARFFSWSVKCCIAIVGNPVFVDVQPV